eukprot:11184993-Lingulodinium_polyedra.AAC.1
MLWCVKGGASRGGVRGVICDPPWCYPIVTPFCFAQRGTIQDLGRCGAAIAETKKSRDRMQ